MTDPHPPKQQTQRIASDSFAGVQRRLCLPGLAIGTALVLAGCSAGCTAQEELSGAESACENAGYIQGTDSYTQCVAQAAAELERNCDSDS